VSDILSLRANISRNTQVASNLSSVKTEVDTAEQALSNAEQFVERARTLATQGATGTQTAQTRASIAQEVQSIQDQLISLANTQVGTRYVFGGDADQSATYAADTVNPDVNGGAVQLTATQATRQIEDPLGNTFTVDRTAQQIFDDQNPDGTPAADNVFTAVNQLRVALQANDTPGIENSLTALATAGDSLNQQLGFYGAAQNRVQAATDMSQQVGLEYQTALSGKQDADMTAAILELTQGQIQEQASLSARAKRPQTSLFDYLR
jgi:flagellar hook-associated protein 3 FlgL